MRDTDTPEITAELSFLLPQHCLLSFIIQGGSLIYFYTEDWQIVNEFKHVIGMCHMRTLRIATFTGKLTMYTETFVCTPWH